MYFNIRKPKHVVLLCNGRLRAFIGTLLWWCKLSLHLRNLNCYT